MIWSSRIGCFHRQTWCFDQQTLWYTGDIMGITCPNWMKQMTTSLRRHWNDTYYGNYAKIALLCQFQRFIVIDAEKKTVERSWRIIFYCRKNTTYLGSIFGFKGDCFLNVPCSSIHLHVHHLQWLCDVDMGHFTPPAGVHRALGPDVSPCSRPAEPIWASADWRSSCNAAHQVSTE